MLVGLAFIIVIGILLSDHMKARLRRRGRIRLRAGSDVRGGTTTPAPAAQTVRTEIPPPSIPTQPMPTQQRSWRPRVIRHSRRRARPYRTSRWGRGGTPVPPTNIAIQGSAPQPPPVAIGPGTQTQPPLIITQPPAGTPNPGPVVLAQPDSPSPKKPSTSGPADITPSPLPAAPEPRRTNAGGVPMAAVKQYKAEAGDNLHKMAL